MKLYVGNLPYNVTDSDLAELFGQFGQVESAKVIADRYSGQSKGFGFVEMGSRGEGHKAMETLNGSKLQHRDLVVNEAKPPGKKGHGNRGRRW